MNPVRALILDDSAICRMQLRSILELDGHIKIVGEASNGDRVLQLIEQTKPNVLLVDLEMPGTAGHATIERVMANHPLPILVVTGLPKGRHQAEIFESIRRGALELAAKPTRGDRVAEARLRTQVRQLASIPVVRHVAGKLGTSAPVSAPKLPIFTDVDSAVTVVGVGASAGGPIAMATMLAELPSNFPAAIVVVQHLPAGFTRAFAQFLSSRVSLPVQVVSEPITLEASHIYVAPDDRHLVVGPRSKALPVLDSPVEGHRPSVDVLFRSLAQTLGPRALGVIMSGMGRDGVAGLLAMRKAGSLTLAQDEASCGVFGMPLAAHRDGAVVAAHPPLGLARVLIDFVRSSNQGACLDTG